MTTRLFAGSMVAWFVAVAMILSGCHGTGEAKIDPVSLATLDGGALNEVRGHPESAPPIPFRAVDLLRKAPERGYRTIGPILVFVEKPIPGLTSSVAFPLRWCNPPPSALVRESGGSLFTTTLEGRRSVHDVELHEALQSRAAMMGANAVIVTYSGVDQYGRLWAGGTAIAK